MPKGKRKGKSDRRGDGSVQTSDDDSIDNVSIVSNYSENKSLEDGDEGADELTQLEQLESQLLEIVEALSSKSSGTRITNFNNLRKALVKKYLPNFVRDRHFTIGQCVDKSLKRGSADEKIAAADLIPLLALQLGDEKAGDAINESLRPVLLTSAEDNALVPEVRAKCCLALGVLGFIYNANEGDMVGLMQTMEAIFSKSFIKGDNNAPTVSAENAALHAAALSAWILLLTSLDAGTVCDLTNGRTLVSPDQLSGLLESAHLEVRLTAGEALAIIFECGRRFNDEFQEDLALCVTPTLKELATDSNKFRSKKDRKQQRATFRDILQYIEDNQGPDINHVKFGREILDLDTWVKRKQYDALCAVLGPGINQHLSENYLLRDIFNIITPILESDVQPAHAQQIERQRKRIVNAAAFKARTISRGRNRDKRCDF